MTTLRHPAFKDVTLEVADECVDGWVASGWIDDRPKPAPKPGPKKPPRSATTTR